MSLSAEGITVSLSCTVFELLLALVVEGIVTRSHWTLWRWAATSTCSFDKYLLSYISTVNCLNYSLVLERTRLWNNCSLRRLRGNVGWLINNGVVLRSGVRVGVISTIVAAVVRVGVVSWRGIIVSRVVISGVACGVCSSNVENTVADARVNILNVGVLDLQKWFKIGKFPFLYWLLFSLKESQSSRIVEVIVSVVDCFNIEASGITYRKSRYSTVCIDHVLAGLSWLQLDIDGLGTAAISGEVNGLISESAAWCAVRAEILGKHLAWVAVRARVRTVLQLRAVLICRILTTLGRLTIQVHGLSTLDAPYVVASDAGPATQRSRVLDLQILGVVLQWLCDPLSLRECLQISIIVIHNGARRYKWTWRS